VISWFNNICFQTQFVPLPWGFDKWDEHHKKIWLASKKAHQHELREAERARLSALAAANEVELKNDKQHHEVLHEHAVTHAKAGLYKANSVDL
jgi:hypothetical protein